MIENILEVKDLHYTYIDGTHALKGVTLDIKQGMTTAVLGGNGAGKSTLFLSLNGTLKPTAGKVLFKGLQLDYSRKGLRDLRKSVGIVFQDPDSQLFSASVLQDISFGPINMKLPEEEVRKRVNAAMDRIGISHLKDKPTHCLSFGQKKRVAIAGVLAMEPEVLVLRGRFVVVWQDYWGDGDTGALNGAHQVRDGLAPVELERAPSLRGEFDDVFLLQLARGHGKGRTRVAGSLHK